MTAWQQWLQHPERSRVRNAFFQIHLWMGGGAAAYILLVSISGSVIVYRNELSKTFFIEWLVKLHENLLAGSTGRLLNGVGGICVTSLCLTGAVIWWPGVKNWRRSLTVSWRAHFARINWDLHSALGFWCFLFILLWGISGIYFSFPHLFDALFILDPADHFTDQGLFWLSELHFGRFGWFTEALWSLVGLVPAVLAFTGVFICCRRMIYKKPSNPNTQSD
ncbi:MAG: PepSY-associated TM helix domain-containing protein [Bryobacteraceae bacterium]